MFLSATVFMLLLRAAVIYSYLQVWRANGSFKPLIQTLHGHTSQVSALCDGCDGSVLSCSVDGSVRVWSPQQVLHVSPLLAISRTSCHISYAANCMVGVCKLDYVISPLILNTYPYPR